MQLIFAGAATVATLALFGAGSSSPQTAVATRPQSAQTAPGAAGDVVIDVDDGGVNDNGQTSGDIFTQNAQDQSTANGAGT